LQNYSNGILCRELTYKKDAENNVFNIYDEKNFLSDKLISEINKRINACERRIGFMPKTDEIENSILKGISSYNVFDVLDDYIKSTGNDLIQEIVDNKMELGYEKQKELLTHLTSMTRESTSKYDPDHYFEGECIGYELQFAIKNKDKEMLKETLNKINKDNINTALDYLYPRSGNNSFTDFSDKATIQILEVLGGDAGECMPKLEKALIENINKNGGYTKDIVDDLESHMGSSNKTVVNFTRLLNRCYAGQSSTITGKPDGKIDINNIQQKGTGDCWLIASIISATNKNQKGLDYINNMLSVDNNGNVTVKLNGVNKTYVISAEEIEKSNHLASGDPDMRAIEIAIDKYMKELAYEAADNGNIDFSRADINGDNVRFAYNVLMGNGFCNNEPNIQNEDYNSENLICSLSFGNDPNVIATVSSKEGKEKEVNLIGHHAYAIKGSDNNYIYLINPHNSAETLKVKREMLKTKNPRVYYALIKS
jgi:hypothetical protein